MDFGVSAPDLVTKEFLAIVLAGFGNELVPLTSDHGEEPCPKALLPIGNRPMLEYPLSWIDQSGITNVLLICPSAHRAAISHYIHSSTSFSSLRIDLQTYDESQDITNGTCALLRHFSNRIANDFILVPCDLVVPSSLPLTKILNKFRTESTSDGAIATGFWFESQNPHLGKDSIPEEWGTSNTITPIVWDVASGTLLHIDTPDDQDLNGEEVELRMALLSKYPRTKLSTKFQDSHVYVCRRSVLDVLQQKPHMDSLREEFFPWLCRIQYQRTKRNKYDRILGPPSTTLPQSTALRHSTLQPITHEHTSATFSPTASPYLGSMALSAPPSVTDEDDEDAVPMSFRVGIVIHEAKDGYVARANNLHSLLSLSRNSLTAGSYMLPTDPKNRSLIDQKATISPDSLIGDSTRVEERASIKKSVIGKHCVIGKMAKIANCVLLDHCVVGEGAKLDGSILGVNTKVGPKAELLRCVTQAGYEVEEGETFKNEKLDVSGWAAGSEESDEENEEEESGDDDEDESEGDGSAKEQSAADVNTSVAAKGSVPEPSREAGDAKIDSSVNNEVREDGSGGGSPETSKLVPHLGHAAHGEAEAGKQLESGKADDGNTAASSQLEAASLTAIDTGSDEEASDAESTEESSAGEGSENAGSGRPFQEPDGSVRTAGSSILPAPKTSPAKAEQDASGSGASGGRNATDMENDQAHAERDQAATTNAVVSSEVRTSDDGETGLGSRPSKAATSSQESGKSKPPEKAKEGYRESKNESSEDEDEESSSEEGSS